ncbi:hypothetical protein [Hymenobacter rubidus]|uniref:hypothetical protein n=1 Tax=Hymenobacter rubidus TaxID=1441626 RepID=UPI00191DF92F|nr:hypothetical protein [Hymenobacter rubidus]
MPKILLLGLLLCATIGPVEAQRHLPGRARPLRKALLDQAIPETSALLYTDGNLWTLNDSGNPPVLFRLDSATGRVVQRVHITNFPNVDWEELAADARCLYIGDFGNNAGNRHNLRVLRVAKSAISPAPDVAVAAEEIAFRYPDQQDFSPGAYRHNFDCEAFFYAHDSLHLFTKNWADQRTRYYTLPAQPGNYVAHYKGSFDARGLVTAAALSPAGTSAALLGYTKTGRTFLWLLTDFTGTSIFSGQQRRLKLPHALRLGQAEGLCFIDADRVFLSNERLPKRFRLVRQRLYALDLRRWLNPR